MQFTSYLPPPSNTSYPPPPSTGTSSLEIITPTGNSTPWNNPPKEVPHLPNDPDSYPSLSDSSLLESLESLDYGHSKPRQRTCKKRRSQRNNNNSIKIAPELHPSYLKLRKFPRSWGLNLMRILYSTRFIYWILLIHLDFLSQFKQTWTLLMDYPSMRVEDFQIMLNRPLGTCWMDI